MGASNSKPMGGYDVKDHLAKMDKELDTKRMEALEPVTLAKQAATLEAYDKWAEEVGYRGPLERAPLALFLEHKCIKNRSAKSHATWRTNVVKAMARRTGKPVDMGAGAGLYFWEEKRRLAKLYGAITHRVVEWGKVELLRIATECGDILRSDIFLYAIFAQACIAYATLLRPMEHAGHKFQVALGDITYLPVDEGLPHGGFRFLLGATNEQKSKGMVLAGSEKGERVFAAGTGDVLCPVSHLRCMVTLYGLDRTGMEKEPLFAALREDGTRVTMPDGTGAPPIPREQYAKGLAKLAKMAGIGAITPRGSRAGALVDNLAEGVDHLPIMAQGRWRSVDVIVKAYNRSSVVSLKGIVAAKKRALVAASGVAR